MPAETVDTYRYKPGERSVFVPEPDSAGNKQKPENPLPPKNSGISRIKPVK